MSISLKEIPEFKNEEEEFEFWSTHDSAEYHDAKNLKRVPPLSEALLSIVLPPDISDEVDRIAREENASRQDIAIQLLSASIHERELRKAA